MEVLFLVALVTAKGSCKKASRQVECALDQARDIHHLFPTSALAGDIRVLSYTEHQQLMLDLLIYTLHFLGPSKLIRDIKCLNISSFKCDINLATGWSE